MTTVTEASRLSHAAIREYAERIGDHHEIYNDEGLADIDVLVERLGGTVVFADSDESLHVNDKGDFTIYLPKHTSARRDRFTLAHELGHYFLHYLYPKVEGVKKFGRGDRNPAETQANIFASSLLMPSKEFIKVYEESGGDDWDLAGHFGVSPAAADVRARVLGLR